jgi:PAS domain S-box-containing protein
MKKQENYHAIFENAPFALAVCKIIFDEQNNSVDFVFIDANTALEEYIGLKLSNILRKRATEVIPGIENKSFIETFGAVVITGIPIHFEDFFGPLQRYYHINAYKLGEDTLAAVFQDITEQRYAHELLQESERKYRTLFESTLSPVLIVDVDGNYKDANNAALMFLETDLNSLRQKKVGDYDPERLHGKQVEEHSPFISPKTIETYYEINGKEKVLLLNILPVDTKEGIRLFGIGLDITERKHAEEALRKSEKQFRLLAENAQDLIYRYEFMPHRGFAYVSPAALVITGYTPEEHYADPDIGFKLVHPDDRHLLSAAPNSLVNQDKPLVLRWVKKDGTILWTEQHNLPIYDSEGNLIAIEGIARDITECKHCVEESLRRERQLSNAMNIAKLGHWELDVPSGIFTFSDSFYTMFRTTVKEMGGYEMAIDDYTPLFVHPEDQHVVSEETRKAIESDDPNFSRYMEHRMLYADGGVGYMAVQFFIVKDDNGKTVKTYGVNQDITERKQTADALKESEARLKTALKNSPVVLFNQDLELRYTWIHNPNPLFDPNSVIGKTDYELLPNNDAACLTNLKRCVIETGIMHREEVRTTIHGEPFFYDLTVEPLFDSTGAIVGVSCASIDMTERKRAEEALAAKSAFESIISQNAHRFLTLENLDDSIDNCLANVGNFCGAQRAYLFQFNPDEINMSNTHEWCAPGVISEIENLQDLPIDMFPWWMKLLQAGEIIRIENVAELPPEAWNEKEILEAQNVSSLLVVPFLVKSKLAGFIGFDDIYLTRKWSEKELTSLTVLAEIIGVAIERKRSEEELVKSKEAAEAANVAKSEFLSIMSHELRTPMNAIIGFTDILSETKLAGEQQRYVEILKKSSDRLLNLIEDILDLSKIEEGKFELEILDFDLSEIMEILVDTMGPRANEKSLKLRYNIEDDVPLLLLGDKYCLIQILTNLVSNSIKFTSKGEVEIKISVESQEKDVVMLRFMVCDTGIGIPKEKVSQIFERFYQIDSSSTRRFGGVGLGLPISKKLAEMMGGDLGLNSEVGKGSEFWFTVKVNIQPKSNREEKLEHVNLLQKEKCGLTILLVEDDIFNQELTQNMLNIMGFKVDTVSNGLEAIKALETVPYDLVLMDIQMPVMDGVEATRQIRSSESTVLNKNVPIIALTAHAMKGDMELFIHEGMDDYLSKPITINALRELLDKWRDYPYNPEEILGF